MKYHELLDQAKDYVLAYFDTHPQTELLYHDKTHTKDVVDATMEIANHYQLNEKDFFVVMVAAWFHDIGYFDDRENHELKSASLANDFLKKNDVEAGLRDKVEQVILATKMPQKPTNLLEEIVCDGDLYHLGTDKCEENQKAMRKEIALVKGLKLSKQQWREENLAFLLSHHYHTDYAKLLLGDKKQENINKLRDKIKNNEEKLDGQQLPVGNKKKVKAPAVDVAYAEEKGKKDKAKPSKGIETMFRITSGNNQKLSDMADNKAHIMITVNSIILSLIVSLVLRRLEDNAFLIIPTFILLMVALACIIFSILATRPSIPEGVFTINDLERKKVNLLFFGNFYKMSLGDYSKGMNQVMNDKVFLYETLITDVYSQGVVLGRKYKLLRISYNIFMFGLIGSVLAYVVCFIAYGKL